MRFLVAASNKVSFLFGTTSTSGICSGTLGSFSFSAPKIISTGQGGALITNSDQLNAKIRKLKDFGRSSGGNDIHDSIGFNSKFTELQACIGIEQMKKLHSRIIRKKEMWNMYKDLLSSCKEIQLFNHNLEYTTPWFIDIKAERREDLINFLKVNNIGTRIMYPPINKQQAYNEETIHKNSELIGKKGLWLPSSITLQNDQIEYICKKIRDFYR